MHESGRWSATAITWLTAVVLMAWPGPSLHAQAPLGTAFVCPVDPLIYPDKCEKLARRHERGAVMALYPMQHPLRVSAIVEGDAFMLGLGDLYVAGFWGVAAGPSLVYEVAPPWALRFDLIGRLGHGHISSWNVDSPGPIDASAGYLGGVAARTAVLRRMRVMYFGGTLALGFVHLTKRTLHEQDFDDSTHDFDKTVRVPRDAAYFAAGFVLGGELSPGGRVGFNVHLTPGAWNDFRHLYMEAAFVVSVKLWD